MGQPLTRFNNMIEAGPQDRVHIVEMLSRAFADNRSVNYIIKQDSFRDRRVRRLVEYSYEVCLRFGKVLLSDDRRACALVLYPDREKMTLQTALANLRLLFSSIGVSHLFRVMRRESRIRKHRRGGRIYYLWFIGVDPENQHRGAGSSLLREIIADSTKENRELCLETSTPANLPWYRHFGFTLYDQLNFGYDLYFLKR